MPAITLFCSPSAPTPSYGQRITSVSGFCSPVSGCICTVCCPSFSRAKTGSQTKRSYGTSAWFSPLKPCVTVSLRDTGLTALATYCCIRNLCTRRFFAFMTAVYWDWLCRHASVLLLDRHRCMHWMVSVGDAATVRVWRDAFVAAVKHVAVPEVSTCFHVSFFRSTAVHRVFVFFLPRVRCVFDPP